MDIKKLLKQEIVIVSLLFAVLFWFWLTPVSESPFGDVDSSTHFGLGDYMEQNDRSIYALPTYLDYGKYHNANNGYLWYPPQYHLNEGLVQIFSGERTTSAYILNALLSVSVTLAVFLFIRGMYGFWPGILSMGLVGISMRDIQLYLWGLWPQSASFAFVPIVLYAFYQYITKKKNVYLYLCALLLSAQFFFHPQGTLHSIPILGVISILLMIKEKKFWIVPFKNVIGPLLVLLVLIGPFIGPTLSYTQNFQAGANEDRGINIQIDRLVEWYPEAFNSTTQALFGYQNGYGALYTVPLVLLGIAFVLLRRKTPDLFMIGLLVSFYVFMHLDLIGIGDRLDRSIMIEAHFFYPLMVLGLLSIPSFLKVKSKDMVKLGLIVAFAALMLFTNIPRAQAQFDSVSGIRVTPEELEALDWIKENLPEEAHIRMVGGIIPGKNKMIRVLSQRKTALSSYGSTFEEIILAENHEDLAKTDHVMMAYADLLLTGNAQVVQGMQAWESQYMAGREPLFANDHIRIYYAPYEEYASALEDTNETQ